MKNKKHPQYIARKVNSLSGEWAGCWTIYEDQVPAMLEKMARDIHAERNLHEGVTVPFALLHEFQQGKFRGYAYAALAAIGIKAEGKR